MLIWNVYVGDFNTGKIKLYNIFNHYSFYNDCVKAKKKFKDDKEGFAEEVRRDLHYYFWSKCEWEIILDHWPSGELYDMRRTLTAQDMYSGLKYPEDKLLAAPDKRFEIRVFPEHNRFGCEKIDVYSQVMLNWDVFIEYLWNNRKELKARKKDG